MYKTVFENTKNNYIKIICEHEFMAANYIPFLKFTTEN